MDLSDLSRKQKRLRDWTEFLDSDNFDPKVRNQTETALKSFKAALIRCWENEEVTDEDAKVIEGLERQLTQLNEELRFRGRPGS